MEKEKPTKMKLCSQPHIPDKVFDKSVSANRADYINTYGTKWVNGTEIKYMFVEGPESQKKVVRDAFNIWKSIGIGISFKEVSDIDDSIVRIGFDLSDGSWSYVGRHILTIPKSHKTMNFGWDLTADSYGMTTALHEIGHTLGFQHEHQNFSAGIIWNVPAVYQEFSGPPNNWSRSQIDSNILSKLPSNGSKASPWDPKSIMEYEFGKGLILEPVAYQIGVFPPGVLSAVDKEGVKLLYPLQAEKTFASLQKHQSLVIAANSGGQSDFVFEAPNTGKFTFQTVGDLDTVMVIFEKNGDEKYYLAGDDDSGLEQNSQISLPLIKGREYLVNIRVMYSPGQGTGSLIVS